MVVMIVTVVVVGVVVVIGCPARAFGGAGLGALDGGGANKGVGTEHHAAADRFTRLGVSGERGVLDRLAQFVTPGLLAGAWHGFVDVSQHGERGVE